MGLRTEADHSKAEICTRHRHLLHADVQACYAQFGNRVLRDADWTQMNSTRWDISSGSSTSQINSSALMISPIVRVWGVAIDDATVILAPLVKSQEITIVGDERRRVSNGE